MAKLDNVRCTVFVDKFISLGKFSDFVKLNLPKENVSTVLYQNIPPIINAPILHWGLLCDKRKIVEVHDNKFDFYSYLDDESEISRLFLELIEKILIEFKFSVRRLAFAPTYIVPNDQYSDYCSKNISNYKFKNSLIQNFSLSQVFYLTENVEDTSFNMIYNANIATQTSFVNPQERGQLIVSVDINTKDTGNIIFTNNQVKTFYNYVPSFNEEFKKNLGLEDINE